VSPSVRPALPELDYTPTFPGALRRAASRFGADPFVVLPDERMTYAEAEERSRALAKRFLAAGLGKGSRVGLFFTYSTEFVVAWLAALRIGALVMPFSSIYRPAELRTVVRIGDVSLLLAAPEMLGRDLQPLLEEALPGLGSSTRGPLRLTETPYLREVWLTGPSDRPWAHVVDLTDTSDDHGVTDELPAARGSAGPTSARGTAAWV
jgi:acyl-CoA synthetase (AMP-forming)/AMP-acid ligase II